MNRTLTFSLYLLLSVTLGCSTVEIINDHALPKEEQQTYRSHHLFYKEIPSQASLGACPDTWYSIRMEKDWVSTSVTRSQLALGGWSVFGGVPLSADSSLITLYRVWFSIGGLNHATRVWDRGLLLLNVVNYPALRMPNNVRACLNSHTPLPVMRL